MWLRPALWFRLATLVLLLGSCAALNALVAPPRFTAWRLYGAGAADDPALDQSTNGLPYTMEFGMTTVSGTVLCNQYSGSYELNPFTHTLRTYDVSSTLMGCSEASIPSLRGFGNGQKDDLRYVIDGDVMKLYYDRTHQMLLYRRIPMTQQPFSPGWMQSSR